MLCLAWPAQELKASEEDISFMPPQWRLILGETPMACSVSCTSGGISCIRLVLMYYTSTSVASSELMVVTHHTRLVVRRIIVTLT